MSNDTTVNGGAPNATAAPLAAKDDRAITNILTGSSQNNANLANLFVKIRNLESRLVGPPENDPPTPIMVDTIGDVSLLSLIQNSQIEAMEYISIMDTIVNRMMQQV